MSLRQLASLANQEAGDQLEMETAMLMEIFTQYIGTLGIDSVIPPAAISVPSAFKEAIDSPFADKWMEAMKRELNSFYERQIAVYSQLAPFRPTTRLQACTGY